jgi:hypothetical protein
LCFLGCFCAFFGVFLCFLGVNFLRGTTPKRGIPALLCAYPPSLRSSDGALRSAPVHLFIKKTPIRTGRLRARARHARRVLPVAREGFPRHCPPRGVDRRNGNDRARIGEGHDARHTPRATLQCHSRARPPRIAKAGRVPSSLPLRTQLPTHLADRGHTQSLTSPEGHVVTSSSRRPPPATPREPTPLPPASIGRTRGAAGWLSRARRRQLV